MKRYLPILLLLAGCIKPYNPPVNYPSTGYLIVEGNINNGPGPTRIILSRSGPLSDTATEVFEQNALVTLEGSDGTQFTATGSGGVYLFNGLALDASKQYRLDIHTVDGNEFQSDYVPVIPNPPIDSVNAILKPDGMHLYVNTHNPSGNTRYYQWSYTETWQYTAAELSDLEFDPVNDTVVLRPPADQIYNCWKQDSSTALILYSTTKLARDEVYEFPLVAIPEGDQRLSVEYSLSVHQYALSQAGYDYLELMQASTENLGSIFDPLPTGLKGNIHCLTQPTQTVVGFVNVSQEQDTRVFLPEPPGWPYTLSCAYADTAIGPAPKDIYTWFYSGVAPLTPPEGVRPKGIYIPLYNATPGPGWLSNLNLCVDCRLQGGTNAQPSFWP
jgi:hypothetical protein